MDAEPDRPVRASKNRAREREDRVWSLRVRGFSQTEIAKRLGMSRAGVRKVLDRVEKRVLARIERRVKRIKARQSAQIEHLLMEAMAAWEKSKLPARKRRVRTVTVKIQTPDGSQTIEQPGRETTVETTYRDGDPRWLELAAKLLGDERALFGLDIIDEPPDPLLDSVRHGLQAKDRWESLPPAEQARRLAFRAELMRANAAKLAENAAALMPPTEETPDGTNAPIA